MPRLAKAGRGYKVQVSRGQKYLASRAPCKDISVHLYVESAIGIWNLNLDYGDFRPPYSEAADGAGFGPATAQVEDEESQRSAGSLLVCYDSVTAY